MVPPFALITRAMALSFSESALRELDDQTLERLAAPLRYDIRFETEVYRSGKKHIRKTRYKDNPFGKIIGKH